MYAYWGLWPTRITWVVQTYRRRYGIETSYRQMNQARVRTSTRSPLVRLFFIGLALVLRNLWAWLHWEALAEPRRGGRDLRAVSQSVDALSPPRYSASNSLPASLAGPRQPTKP